MRPAYLTPKLTDAHRLEIRRLRTENPKAWTHAKLAGKFGVHRTTIAHVLRHRMRKSMEHDLAGARLIEENAGPIDTGEVLRLKTEEWNRQLLAESDLARQLQLLNLIRSTAPMMEELAAEARKARNDPDGLGGGAAAARMLARIEARKAEEERGRMKANGMSESPSPGSRQAIHPATAPAASGV